MQSSTNVLMDEIEIPSLMELLVSLSTSARNRTDQRDVELRNTLRALLSREALDNAPRGEYTRLAILLGFKRRNHSKARASGDGDGERGFLRAVLLELTELAGGGENNGHLTEQVNAVLPLVPHYGSWRDLLVLGEMAFPVSDGVESPADALCLPPLGLAVARVFAEQLRRDVALLEPSKEGRLEVPSNACKYAPHEKRHTGNTPSKGRRERPPAKSDKAVRANRIQRRLADAIAEQVLSPRVGEKSSRLRADYRKLLSRLKAVLTVRGFVIEPLLCKRDLQAINFKTACKGALAKHRKCLERDPKTKTRWRQAMLSSSAAVADVDSLLQAAQEIVADRKSISDPCERTSSLRVMKCVESLRESQAALRTRAAALLEQVDCAGLLESLEVTVLPVVDSSGCETEEEFVSLVLAAYVAACAQGASQVVVDGKVQCLPAPDPLSPCPPCSSAAARRAEAAERRKVEAQATSEFLERVCDMAAAVFGRGGADLGPDQESARAVRRLDCLDRIRRNAGKALASVSSGGGEAPVVDVLYLTSCDMATEVPDADSYRSLVGSELQSPAVRLRSVSLCRVSELPGSDVETPLVLRHSSTAEPSEQSLDLCLVMDLTGSMGSWMEAAKTHLTDIVRGLQKETKVGSIRVSYIGYRDWQDEGRLVCHDFVPIATADTTVIPLMQEQDPSGGNDMEEDVLIAFHAALGLGWQGDMRVMLHLADAPAHGYGQRGSGDRFKDGRCPDQKIPYRNLPKTLEELARNKVDLLFCRLDGYGNSCVKMEKMFSGVYGDGPGFGVLPLERGASKFKHAILSTLSSSMLRALAPADVAGVQSFSGGTASTLLRVLNSSLRESVAAAAAEMMGSGGDGEELAEGLGLEGVSCSIPGEEWGEEDEEAVCEPAAATAKTALTTEERLMSELEASELQPVRLALGLLPISSGLQAAAAAVLLECGVTAGDLQLSGYPEEVMQLMRDEGGRQLEQL